MSKGWFCTWLEGPPEAPPGWQAEWLDYTGTGRAPYTRDWYERKYRYRERYRWLWMIAVFAFLVVHGARYDEDVWIGLSLGVAAAYVLRGLRKRKYGQSVVWPWLMTVCPAVAFCCFAHPNRAGDAALAGLATATFLILLQRILRWFWKRRRGVAVAFGVTAVGVGGVAAWEAYETSLHHSSSISSPSYTYSASFTDTSAGVSSGDGWSSYQQPQPLPGRETLRLPPGNSAYYAWAQSQNRFGDCAISLVPEPMNTSQRSLRIEGFSQEDAEDLTLDAMVKACKKYQNEFVESLPKYYYGILRNVKVDFYERSGRRAVCPPYPPTCTPYDWLERAEQLEILEWAACQLSQREEWVVRLKLDGMSSREIADVLTQNGKNLTPNQVDNAWDNGRKKLSVLVQNRYGCN